MKLVDKRCDTCGEVVDYVPDDEVLMCPKCNVEMKRLFGYKKYKEFIPGLYYHLDPEPIWIESAQQFKKECRKRNLEQQGGYGAFCHE